MKWLVLAVLAVLAYVFVMKRYGSVGNFVNQPLGPPAVPTVANSETKGGFSGACNTVYGAGSQAATSSGDPRGVAVGSAMQFTGPLMCNYVYPAVGGAIKSGGKAVGGAIKSGGKAVGNGVVMGSKNVAKAASSVGGAISKGVSKLKFW